jgi:hypothetical protein
MVVKPSAEVITAALALLCYFAGISDNFPKELIRNEVLYYKNII